MTNVSADGWRYIFWIQAAFHGATSLGLFLFYWPPKNVDYPKMTLKHYIWACDPIGSVLFVCSATLLLLALDWAGGAYTWSDPQVAAPLALGLALLVVFGAYGTFVSPRNGERVANTLAEWKGRSDGLLAHVFFKHNANFALSTFAFAVEGWIFYSAVNSVVPQIVLNLGFQTDSWAISIRQLSYSLLTMFASIPITWYATVYKDLKTPLLVTFAIFLIVLVDTALFRVVIH